MDISELRAVPGPKVPGLGEFECTLLSMVGSQRPDLRTRNYCVRGGSPTGRSVEPGKWGGWLRL